MCNDNDEKYQTKETARGIASSMEKLETGILIEIWSCIIERFQRPVMLCKTAK